MNNTVELTTTKTASGDIIVCKITDLQNASNLLEMYLQERSKDVIDIYVIPVELGIIDSFKLPVKISHFDKKILVCFELNHSKQEYTINTNTLLGDYIVESLNTQGKTTNWLLDDLISLSPFKYLIKYHCRGKIYKPLS